MASEWFRLLLLFQRFFLVNSANVLNCFPLVLSPWFVWQELWKRNSYLNIWTISCCVYIVATVQRVFNNHSYFNKTRSSPLSTKHELRRVCLLAWMLQDWMQELDVACSEPRPQPQNTMNWNAVYELGQNAPHRLQSWPIFCSKIDIQFLLMQYPKTCGKTFLIRMIYPCCKRWPHILIFE